jgi:hypothetical protein
MSFLHYAYPFYVDSGAGFDDGGELGWMQEGAQGLQDPGMFAAT